MKNDKIVMKCMREQLQRSMQLYIKRIEDIVARTPPTIPPIDLSQNTQVQAYIEMHKHFTEKIMKELGVNQIRDQQ